MEITESNVRTIKYSISYTDLFDASSTTHTLGLPLPGGSGYLLNLMGRVTTAFAGITGPVQVKVGFGTPIEDGLLIEQNVGVAGALVSGGAGVGQSSDTHQLFCSRMNMPIGNTTPLEIRAKFTSSSGNLEDLTAGAIELVAVYAI